MAKILCVDDDEVIRVFLSEILVDAGHEVIELADGMRVCELMKNEQPDLIVCDLVMPTREGIETIKRLRSNYPNFPIIAISSSDIYLNLAEILGANSVLEKPINGSELVKTIDTLLHE